MLACWWCWFWETTHGPHQTWHRTLQRHKIPTGVSSGDGAVFEVNHSIYNSCRTFASAFIMSDSETVSRWVLEYIRRGRATSPICFTIIRNPPRLPVGMLVFFQRNFEIPLPKSVPILRWFVSWNSRKSAWTWRYIFAISVSCPSK